MTGALRVALLSPDANAALAELAAGLASLGHQPHVIASPSAGRLGGLESRLRRRGYVEHLTCAPSIYAQLRRGDHDLAHAAHPAAVPAAVRWARRTSRPFVFHYPGIPDHADLMSHRKKLELLEAAVREAAAVVATSEAGSDAFERWLGADARLIEADAGPEPWAELYTELTR